MLQMSNAKELAYWTEYPDNVMDKEGNIERGRPTWLNPFQMIKTHALTGGDPIKARNATREKLLKAIITGAPMKEIGRLLHKFGDTYAHTDEITNRLFMAPLGHLLFWKKPDKLGDRPEMYLDYVNDLSKTLGGNSELKIDMTIFKYIANKRYDSKVNASLFKAEFNLQNKVQQFKIESENASKVVDYLDERKKSGAIEGYKVVTTEVINKKGKKVSETKVEITYKSELK